MRGVLEEYDGIVGAILAVPISCGQALLIFEQRWDQALSFWDETIGGHIQYIQIRMGCSGGNNWRSGGDSPLIQNKSDIFRKVRNFDPGSWIWYPTRKFWYLSSHITGQKMPKIRHFRGVLFSLLSAGMLWLISISLTNRAAIVNKKSSRCNLFGCHIMRPTATQSNGFRYLAPNARSSLYFEMSGKLWLLEVGCLKFVSNHPPT